MFNIKESDAVAQLDLVKCERCNKDHVRHEEIPKAIVDRFLDKLFHPGSDCIHMRMEPLNYAGLMSNAYKSSVLQGVGKPIPPFGYADEHDKSVWRNMAVEMNNYYNGEIDRLKWLDAFTCYLIPSEALFKAVLAEVRNTVGENKSKDESDAEAFQSVDMDRLYEEIKWGFAEWDRVEAVLKHEIERSMTEPGDHPKNCRCCLIQQDFHFPKIDWKEEPRFHRHF